MSFKESINNAEARVVISSIMILSILALFVLIFMVELPNNNKDMAYLVVGNFTGAFGTIIAFWFSSSKGSVDKQKELNKRNQDNEAS